MANPHLHNPALGPLNDFRNFLYMSWKFLKLPEPTKAQYLIAEYLGQGDPSKILMAFRGIGKSYVTAAYVCWLWLINPQWKILVVSASEKKAMEFASMVRAMLKGMPCLQHLQPTKGQRDNALFFDVGPATPAKDPSLNVAGITGQITGGRADHIIADDVEIPRNSSTVGQREKLIELCGEFTNILKPDPWCTITYLGTPQTEQSVYISLEKKGFKIMVIPSEYPKDVSVYAGRLHPQVLNELLTGVTVEGIPCKPGQAVDPQRFDTRVLQRKRIELGPSAYELQFMLNPSLSDEDKYPLKLRDFVVMSVNPEVAPVNLVWAQDLRLMLDTTQFPVVGFNSDRFYRPMHIAESWLPYEKRIMAIDPKGRGTDELAYVVLYFLRGFIYIAEWSALRGGYEEENLKALSRIAQRHKINTMVVEDNFGDGMFTALLKPVLNKIHPCTVEEFHAPNTQKHARICDVLEPVLSAHRIVLDERVINEDNKVEKDELKGLWQLTRITRERNSLKKDDRIDVLHIGVKWYQDNLALDVEENERLAKEAEDARNMESFLREVYDGRLPEMDYDLREIGDIGAFSSFALD